MVSGQDKKTLPSTGGFQMKFEYQYADGTPKITVELHKDVSYLEAIEQFERFLRAIGYPFDGHIGVVQDVEENTKPHEED